ncbi:hypothetical protein [uncultured marine virus]|uniref:CRESS-DNA virus Rep endonuclease domain-containing protein n=1 Tax=uncultured marine virus TaxID=186617 RepID=S4TF99_9VIRU|nr:hypothetical protein [uncultured marine virus]
MISSNSSRDLSNIKQISPSRHWFLTLNNYNKEDISTILNSNSSKCSKFIFQEEVGSSGTKHLQGYFYFPEKIRPLSFFTFSNHPYWAKCKSVKGSIEYCSKIDTRNGEVYNRNIHIPKPPYKLNINLYVWQVPIVSLLSMPPNDRLIYWFFEPEGGIGKTTFQKWYFMKFNSTKHILCLSGKSADMKHGIINYIDKTGHTPEIVFINIPKSNSKFISYTGLEEIKDMWFYSGKYDGGMVCDQNPHLLVFSNSEPEYEKMTQRFKVIKL